MADFLSGFGDHPDFFRIYCLVVRQPVYLRHGGGGGMDLNHGFDFSDRWAEHFCAGYHWDISIENFY